MSAASPSLLVPAVCKAAGFLFLATGLAALPGWFPSQNTLASPEIVNVQAQSTDDPDEELLRQAGVATDGPGLIAYLRRHSGKDDDLRRIDQLVRELGDREFKKREAAYQRLEALGPIALGKLASASRSEDAEIARRATACMQAIEGKWQLPLLRAAVRRLVRLEPEGAVPALLHYLPYAFEESLEEEIWFGLYDLAVRPGKASPAFMQALSDPLPARRAVAGCILSRRGDAEQQAAARKLLMDADPWVRLRTAQGLLVAKDKTGLPVLVALLAERPVALAWQAEELLRWAAGEEAPEAVLGAGSPEDRQKCRMAWEAWWRQHGPQLDLNKPYQEHRRPGLMLACAETGRDRWNASLWGCDGKARWELTNSSKLTDAQLLPGDRILLSESTENGTKRTFRLVERDLHGKELWQYRSNKEGIGAYWRLLNGNTFLAGLGSGVFWEIDPAGKEVIAPRERHEPIRIFEPPQPVLERVGFNLTWIRKLDDGPILGLGSRTGASGKFELLAECDPATRAERKRVFLQEPIESPARADKLPNGHYLISCGSAPRVREVDGSGKIVWQHAWGLHVERLRHGNTLLQKGVSSQLGWVAEVDRAGRVVGEIFLERQPGDSRVYLGLVRLGFDESRPVGLDLATSLPHRIKGLSSRNVIVRRASAYFLLEEFGPKVPEAIPALIEALNDPDETVQRFTVEALGKMRETDAFPALLKATKDHRAQVRAHALRLVGAFADKTPEGLSLVLNALKDDNVLVRRAAISAVRGNLNLRSKAVDGRVWSNEEFDKIFLPVIVEAVKDKDIIDDPSKTTVPHLALMALGDLGPKAKAAVPMLREVLKGRDPNLFGYACGALARIGPEAKSAVPDLLEAWNVKDATDADAALRLRSNAIWALAHIGLETKEAVPLFTQALKDAMLSQGARLAAAEALGKIGPEAKEAVPDLIRALNDETLPDFRRVAAQALGSIGPAASDAVPALMRALRDEISYVRDAATKALENIRR